MATSEQEQKGIYVPQHKRLAMGVKLNGQSMNPVGDRPRPTGSLSRAKKK
jgi:hypothetical protein